MKDLNHNYLSSVPVGRPIINTQLYILDQHMKPVPMGTPGELYIGGKAVSEGYLNKEDLTRDKFVKNPFDNEHSLLYKSGDLATLLPDGNIIFLGRTDEQIKIRGYRIELSEIENTLKNHPSVDNVAVLVKNDGMDNKQIYAYISTKQNNLELSKYLNLYLPSYMVPKKIIELESIPLTPNGKVDKIALSSIDTSSYLTKYQQPSNSNEAFVQKVISEVLGHENISIQDNFFDLGMHSLIAMKVINRFIEKFKLKIPLGYLFEFPSVSQLTEEIMKLKDSENAVPSLILKPVSRKENEY